MKTKNTHTKETKEKWERQKSKQNPFLHENDENEEKLKPTQNKKEQHTLKRVRTVRERNKEKERVTTEDTQKKNPSKVGEVN